MTFVYHLIVGGEGTEMTTTPAFDAAALAAQKKLDHAYDAATTPAEQAQAFHVYNAEIDAAWAANPPKA